MKQKETLEECYHKTKWYINKLASYLSTMCNVPIEDLKQEGFFGVVKAREHYNPEKASFFTYAQYWIRTYMYSLAYQNDSNIRIPEEFHFIYSRYIKRASAPDMQDNPNKIALIAKEFGMTEKRLNRAIQAVAGIKSSCDLDQVDKYLSEDDSEIFRRVSDNSEKMIKILKEATTDTEFFVIDHMLGLTVPSPKTLNWVGNILGVTKERVRQIKNAGLEKFKELYLDVYDDGNF